MTKDEMFSRAYIFDYQTSLLGHYKIDFFTFRISTSVIEYDKFSNVTKSNLVCVPECGLFNFITFLHYIGRCEYEKYIVRIALILYF